LSVGITGEEVGLILVRRGVMFIGDPDHIRIIEEKCRVFYRYSRTIHDHAYYICLDSHDTNM